MLHRSLYPQRRVSNRLAALSAVLLLVSGLFGISDSAIDGDRPPGSSISTASESLDSQVANQNDVPAMQAGTHTSGKISLMLFH